MPFWNFLPWRGGDYKNGETTLEELVKIIANIMKRSRSEILVEGQKLIALNIPTQPPPLW
jgi:hypothetical protein